MFRNAWGRFHSTFRLILLIALGIAGSFIFLADGSRLSYAYFDLLQNKTKLERQEHVALVVVDQNALNQLNEKKGLVYPFPREVFGAVARVAAHFSASAIFYDILFTEPSFYGVADDQNFARLLADSKVPVILPDAGPGGSIRKPIEPIADSVTDLASVASKNDSDGIYRRYLGGNSVANTVFSRLMLRSPERSPDFLHYYESQAFPHKNLFELLVAYDEIEDGVSVTNDFSEFKNRVWVVGYSAPGLLDMKPTPVEPRAPGFIIPATGVANALSKHGINAISKNSFMLLLLFSALLSVFAVRATRVRSWTFVAFVFVVLLIPAFISTGLWQFELWASPVPMIAAGAIAGGGELIWVYRTVWREQNRMASIIQHSMSAEMVELVRGGKVTVSRFGETKSVTVLFSDLVGFTELSERLSPHELVQVLNGYFDEVVNLVTTAHGYVDKFIGDAVMAMWGAPIAQKDHALLAYQAAVSFHKAAERYNEKLEKKFPGLNPLATRVGLHTGDAVVGNIGARHRHNFTAIGDTVNIAARLESLCKLYGVRIILSETAVIAAGVSGKSEVVEMDNVIVKGRKSSTRIFTYISKRERVNISHFSEGLQLYYKSEWKAAVELLGRCDFAPARVIRDRCIRSLEHGVPVEFSNGVWTLDTK